MSLRNFFSQKKNYQVYGAKFYTSGLEEVFRLFSSLKAFIYLDAKIEGAFKQGEDFTLKFNDGSRIDCNFLEITENKRIVMSWSSFGFGLPDEKNTIVEIDFSVDKPMTLIYVRQSNIPSRESKKQKAILWKNFLEKMDKEINR